MLNIKILGPGCQNCVRVAQVTTTALNALGESARIHKVTAREDIFKYPILATPGLVINEKLVCAGRIPTQQEVMHWIEQERAALESG